MACGNTFIVQALARAIRHGHTIGPGGACISMTPHGSITIARHGKPALSRDTWLGWRAYIDWWAQYDAGGLASGQTPPQRLVDAANAADTLFTSPLLRARETLQAVAPGRVFTALDSLTEARLPPPRIPLLKLPPRTWGVVARMGWYFGLHYNEESRPQAEWRAHEAVSALEAQTQTGASVLVCAHGWFNRMMRPVLLARGWRCVEDYGDSYWSHRRYEKAE